ncbi:MAG: hypothetical protein Q8936_02845 [Bacillota bacterium]|nr:hypothetical protein [Bacillota bacterium]
MVNITNLNGSNSQIEISNRISEVNIYLDLSEYNKARPAISVQCDPYHKVKLLGNTLLYSSTDYTHYLNLDDILVITLKKSDIDYQAVDTTAYLYGSLNDYNREKAVEVPYSGKAIEHFNGISRLVFIEDKEFIHLINEGKLSAFVVKNN